MAIVHGRAIRSEEIERIISREFGPKQFAGLCNAISWACSRLKCSSLPSFTERVNAKDKGIDAEWQVKLSEYQKSESQLLGLGWNVFQYKQRDIFAQGRDKTFAGLKSALKEAVKDLEKRNSQRPDRYVFFTNIDLSHGQKGELREQILYHCEYTEDIHVQIVGAGELAVFLNDIPHVRSAFFVPERFCIWEKAWADHTRQKLLGANVELTGRDNDFRTLRSLVDDPKVRGIVLSGPHNIGKTRLALEATRHKPIETVIALDPQLMTVSNLLALEREGTETVVIIEDLELGSVQKFLDQALAHAGLKVLITLPTAEKASIPNFGQDDRLQIVPVKPLSYDDTEKLLKAAGAKLEYSVRSWVIEGAGGNPGIILAAVSLGPELRESVEDFAKSVAEGFKQKVTSSFGEKANKVLGLLSLLTHVGIRGKAQEEIKLICSLFGDDLQINTVLNFLVPLQNAGLLQVRGLHAEVIPPFFAKTLATDTLRGCFAQLLSLFAGLEKAARLRLVRRLASLDGEEAEQFWGELFGPSGLFKDLGSALRNVHLLHLITGAVPERSAQLIEEGLNNINHEERLGIKGDVRRDLMWAVEELLFRRETSASALRCLAKLAEAENENIGNNATGVFCEAFYPFHPQLPLALHQRLDLLRETCSSKQTVKLRLVGIKAIEFASSGSRGIILRRGSGAKPLDSRPVMTYGEIWDYIETLADLLFEVANSPDTEVSKAAGSVLPHATAECVIQAKPKEGIARFVRLVNSDLIKREIVLVAGLTGALRYVVDVLEQRKDKASEERISELQQYIDEIEKLLRQFDEGDFGVKLKRWAGGWTREDHDYELDEKGRHIYRYETELKTLAREAVDNQQVLTDELLVWSCSGDAQKVGTFFFWLGRLDTQRIWLAKIEEVGTHKDGAICFSAYFGGLSQNNKKFISDRLDALSRREKITPEAIVRATSYLGGDLSGVKRVEKLLQKKQVDPLFVERILSCGGWVDSLSPGEYLRLVKAIAGSGLENAGAVIDFLGMWIFAKKPIEGKLAAFAWRCLEAAVGVSDVDAFHCDELAAKLADKEVEKGFSLFEKLLKKPWDKNYWNPIGRHGENKFWSKLKEADRARALNIVLSTGSKDEHRFGITWHFREVVDQENDADLLIAFALENEQQAELVSDIITTNRAGFWPIALQIISKYPKNRKIQGALAGGVEQIGTTICGHYSAHLKKCQEEAERVLKDGQTPAATHPWLQELVTCFKERVKQELIFEAQEEINELRSVREDPTAPERLWAIKELVDSGNFGELAKFMSKEELLSVLPRLGLNKDEIREIKKRIESGG